MKLLVVLAVAVACASGDVSHVINSDAAAPILRSDFDISPEGSYQWAYETGNGIAAQADGAVVTQNTENAHIAVKGSYKYISPEGVPVDVVYQADDQGYQPQSNLLPTPPPIPELIQRSLDYIAAHPPAVEKLPVGVARAAPKKVYGK